jgi:lysozyme family protein
MFEQDFKFISLLEEQIGLPFSDYKYGFRQSKFQNINVNQLTYNQALEKAVIYFKNLGFYDDIPQRIQLIHLDNCILFGIRKSFEMIQRSLGVTESGLLDFETKNNINKIVTLDLIKERIKLHTLCQTIPLDYFVLRTMLAWKKELC